MSKKTLFLQGAKSQNPSQKERDFGEKALQRFAAYERARKAKLVTKDEAQIEIFLF